jgi:hypothetical protein
MTEHTETGGQTVSLEWRSPHETPERGGSNARRVLVWLERRHSPPALNAPGRMAFGHRIPRPDWTPSWPADGWFFDGQDEEYRVAAWAYADPPEAPQFGYIAQKGDHS